MPWDGSNNYQYPPGTPGVPDTTIESNKYNAFIDDLVNNDLNRPRPVTRGGTGAIDAATAILNLSGERAKQVITNFDADPFVSGSFYAAAGATSAPVAGHSFIGVAIVQDANTAVIQAYDMDSTPPAAYTRYKKAGVWLNGGAWGSDYVRKTGDVMSGNLQITKANPGLTLDKTASAQSSAVVGSLNSVQRWMIEFGNSVAETGTGNTGSDFSINRYNDAGALLGVPLTINRASGAVNIAQTLIVAGALTANGDIAIIKASPILNLNGTPGTFVSIYGQKGSLPRWAIFLGDGAAEGGSNSGSNFSLSRFDDAGTYIVDAITINRANGIVNVSSQIVSSGSLASFSLMSRVGSKQYTFYDSTGGGMALDIGGFGTAWSIAAANGAVTQIGDLLINKATATINLNSTAGTQCVVNFSKAGATRWQLGKQTDDTLFIYDAVNGILPLILDQVAARTTLGYPNLRLSPSTGSAIFELMGVGGGNATILMYSNGAVGWNLYNRGSDNTLIFADTDQNQGVYMTQNATAWASLSDARLKSDLEEISVSERMQRAELRFGAFTWKKSGKRDLGYTAQDLYRVFPEFVHKGDDDDREIGKIGDDTGIWGVMESKAGLAALAYADELRRRIEALEAR